MTTEADNVVIDNAVSNEPWPWLSYIGHSKLQKVILFILSQRDICDPDVWRGALSLKTVRRLLFKNRRLTASQRASFSRSLRCLEKEGLVNRERSISADGYTTHIGLTQRGYYQAEFEKDWYGSQLVKLLTFYGLLSSKYGKKVNKKQYNQKNVR